jgi:biotin carboxyl carrier protein
MADVTLGRVVRANGDGRASAQTAEVDVGAQEPPVDPRAVRVAVAEATRLPDEEPLVVGPLPEPLAPLPVTWAGRGALGGVGIPGEAVRPPIDADGVDGVDEYLVDGHASHLRLERRGTDRALLHEGMPPAAPRRIVFSGPAAVGPDGLTRREIVVDGWRIEVELEPERRAALRERARRGREATSRGGPTEVHAIIPGRVVSVSIAPGDEVTAGQQILVVEAMKMQNELRAPKDGVVRQVGVAVGRTIEVGDLLLVIE